MKRSITACLLTVVASLLSTTASTQAGPLSYSTVGSTYTEEFDTLPTTGSGTVSGRGPHYINPSWTGATGLTGWQFSNPGGSSSNTEYRAQNGSLAGGDGRGALSLGTTGSTDRALGALATSNQIPAIGLVLTNDTGRLLDAITISYIGEQWRRGDVANPNKLAFAYGLATDISSLTLTNFSALDFTAPNTQASPTEVALNGNLAANRTAKSATISGINWGPGQTLVLRWTAQDISGQDDGLAIDHFQFSAVPEPSSFVLAAVGLLGLVGLIARRRG